MFATQHDIDRIMSVMTAAFPPDFGEAWNRRQVIDALAIGNCHHALADIADGSASASCAAAGFRLSRSGVDEEELLLLAVAPDYRRRGIGRVMLEHLAIDARKRGAARLLLEMRRGNPAEALYRKVGFVPIGERPHYYRRIDGSRVDAITFHCPL